MHACTERALGKQLSMPRHSCSCAGASGCRSTSTTTAWHAHRMPVYHFNFIAMTHSPWEVDAARS